MMHESKLASSKAAPCLMITNPVAEVLLSSENLLALQWPVFLAYTECK